MRYSTAAGAPATLQYSTAGHPHNGPGGSSVTVRYCWLSSSWSWWQYRHSTVLLAILIMVLVAVPLQCGTAGHPHHGLGGSSVTDSQYGTAGHPMVLVAVALQYGTAGYPDGPRSMFG